jgi:hypothetical protein
MFANNLKNKTKVLPLKINICKTFANNLKNKTKLLKSFLQD